MRAFPSTVVLVLALLTQSSVFAQALKNTNRSSKFGSVISGGWGNLIDSNSTNAVIGGGYLNNASERWTTVGGGYAHTASGRAATIGGGWGNMATRSVATVGGGSGNMASGGSSTVGGGFINTASGEYATVPGGTRCQATHIGCFVWSGDSVEDTLSTGDKSFTVRCHGGATFYTGSGTGTGVRLAEGGGAWTSLSDKNAKENFQRVDGTGILAKVAAMPVMTWNYKTQEKSIRHIGPTAQDFNKAFNIGESDTGITTVDADGVALAAIQGLFKELKDSDAQHAKDLAVRDQVIEELKTKLQAVEERLNSFPPAP